MKTKALGPLLLVWSLVFSGLIFPGCQGEQAQPTFLSIQMSDSSQAPLVLVRARDQVDHRQYRQALDTLEQINDSLYVSEWTEDESGFYQLYGANGQLFHHLYFAPGDSLQIVRPDDSEEPMTYSGVFEDFYPLFDEYRQIAWMDDSMRTRYRERYSMSPDTFRLFMEERRTAMDAAFEKRASALEADHPLLGYARTYIEYPYKGDHYDYMEYHNYYANDTFLYFFPDSSFYAFQQTEMPDPADYPFSSRYINLVSGKLEHIFQQEVKDLSDSLKYEVALSKKMAIVQKQLKGVDQDFGFLALARDFTHFMSQDDFYEKLGEMETFMEANHHFPQLWKKFQFQADKMQLIAPGEPAPNLSLPNVNGEEVSLSEFRGKVVYLDFWGTWCYPCLQEMPHSLELQETFQDQEDIAFVYIALEYDEEDIERWRKFVTGEEALSYAPFLEQQAYPGTHLVADKQFNNEQIRPYLVNYAPTYVLIDQEGKIVRPRAPRPSSGEEIEELLTSLITEE